MDTMKICEVLCILNDNKPSEYSGDLLELLSENIKNANALNNIDLETIGCELENKNPISQYLTLNCYFLKQLKLKSLDTDVVNPLSVQQNKIIRDVLRQLMNIGIRFNLQPKLPQRLDPPSESYNREEKSITTDYDRLCYTTKQLIDLLDSDVLRPIVVFVGFQIMLNAVYQIVYCPLKKPCAQEAVNGKVVTWELYEKFVNDKLEFQLGLDKCSTVIPKNIYVKETMLLLKTQCVWLKKAVSENLTAILRSDNGLRTIINSLLDNTTDYDTKTWKALDVIVKLIMSLKSASDFESNICQQIKHLLSTPSRPYESIFVSCTKRLFVDDVQLCRRQFIALLLAPLFRFLDADCKYKFENNDDVTDPLQCTMRLLKLAFVNNHINDPDLPYDELTPCIVVIFRLFAATATNSKQNQAMDEFHKESADILICYFQQQSISLHKLFDCLLFNMTTFSFSSFRKDLTITVANNRIKISMDRSEIAKSNDINFLAHTLLKLIKSTNVRTKFFVYLLNCLLNKETYFVGDVDAVIEKNLLIYNLLSSLADDKNVQKHINDNPKEIVEYVTMVLDSAIAKNVHKCDECETTDFQTTFLLIMILQALTSTSSSLSAGENVYATVLRPLRIIRDECVHEELSKLATSVMNALEGHDRDGDNDKRGEGGTPTNQSKSELDKAIEDVCDPLLPIRGHGLMILGKLIEDKDPDALERKLFVLNIFLQNVKNEDSFIYLSAINGLALMADVFPDIVLETLTDEYASGYASSGHEVRMKLGEVLMKVTRNLGDRVSKYKSLLLNTFMLGSKDDDHLMRASSLSNLGEVCRVLGYQLGSIVNEVLNCIHGVITSDPAVEARRAAVTVLRQLFVGLEAETISFLKDDILDVYRTLKHIYYKDDDDVMRLQAQLALEELNVNVKAFLFSHSVLTDSK